MPDSEVEVTKSLSQGSQEAGGYERGDARGGVVFGGEIDELCWMLPSCRIFRSPSIESMLSDFIIGAGSVSPCSS